MIDKWILKDIGKYMDKAKRVVVLDPSEQFKYLLPAMERQYLVFKTDNGLREAWQSVQEELFIRYEAEKNHPDKNILFYVTRPQPDMSFLFDYCFTHGCIDLSKPVEWLRKKIFSHTGLQINMENRLLLIAAKLSIGKDLDWWKRILQNLEELIAIDKELIPFVADPDNYLKRYDPDVKRLFEEKLFDKLGQNYIAKPAKTLAAEIVHTLFNKLLYNDIDEAWLSFYHQWLDSIAYSEALENYITAYPLDPKIDLWNLHPDHCFNRLDIRQLEQIALNINDKAFIGDKLATIKLRSKSRKASRFVPIWWSSVLTLLEFDTKPLHSCHTIEKVVDYYTTCFYKADRAIRIIYETFLHNEPLVKPLQEYYESLNFELLQHWYDGAHRFKTGQQGFLPQLFRYAKPKTAVIVGDGIRYEIAAYVASKLKKKCKIVQQAMLADMPSETAHNMSALFVGDNKIVENQKEREKLLSEITGKSIVYLKLEAIHFGVEADYLVLTYNDLDSVGEKLQLSSLKLFSELETTLVEKIQLLLQTGYQEVRLIADHGFVLTGILDESDKIDTSVIKGNKEVKERFIRTVEKQEQTDWLSFERHYSIYNYVYAAKSSRPFKSKGMYGYAHGGFTPQEMIVPDFIFSKEADSIQQLKVEIVNKKDLSDVTGELFAVVIQSAGSADLFTNPERSVQIILFKENGKLNSSQKLTVHANQRNTVEFSFEGHSALKVVLVDATTQEQLDTATIRKSNARDFGGLL